MNPYATRGRRRFQENGKLPPITDLTDEISYSEGDVLRAYYAFGQNPDPIVQSKGLEIYKDMMEDDQIKACVELRKQARLSTPWNIVSAEEGNTQADEMADFVLHALTRLPGSFQDSLLDIFSAIEYGFSISELVYELLPDGPFKGKLGLKAIKTREPFNYDFKTDPHGNLIGIVYTGVGAAWQAPFGRMITAMPTATQTTLGSVENPYPPDKFVIYSYNTQFGNFYGRSDLLSAFRSWMSKKLIMKFWNIWLERYASPFIWAQVKKDAGLKPAALKKIDEFLKNLTVKSGVRVSDAVTLNPIQFSTAGGDSYEKAIEAHNRFIAHSILTPNLLGYTQQQGPGSYALGKKHFDAFLWVLNKMGRDCSDIIVGDQIIKRLIKLNYPNFDPDLCPIFKFEGIEEESMEARARIIGMLVSAGLMDPNEPWIREFLTLPKREPEFETQVVEPGEEDNIEGREDDQKTEGDVPLAVPAKQPPEPREAKEAFQERQGDDFERKIRVKEFKRQLDRADNALFKELTGNIEEIRDRLVDFVVSKKIVENGNPRALETDLPIKVTDIRLTLRKWLVKLHFDSKLRQLEEIGRAGVEVEVVRKFEDQEMAFEPWEPLPPQEAVDFFNRKVLAKVVGTDGKKKMVEIATRAALPYYDEKAFAIAGVIRDDLLNDAKSVLLNAIKRQDVVGGVKDLKALFNRYISTGVAVDDELLQPHRLMTIVRTNNAEAVNEGRRAMMEDPDVKGFMEFWEYSAILDERTTDYCRCMDGKTFRSEDLPLLNPPAHYNCRSIAVPITKFEVEDLVAQGKGVNVGEPCLGRMAAFVKKDTFVVQATPSPILAHPASIEHKPPAVMPKPKDQEIPPPAPRAEIDEKFKKELALLVVRCPYKTCKSGDIKLVKKIYNVGEFQCGACKLPFRVSNLGDIYLYDAGTESWLKVTSGIGPTYFGDRK